MRSSLVLSLVLTGLHTSALDGQHASGLTLREYLGSTVALNEADLATLDRGRPINKVVPSRNPSEIYLVGVIHIRASPQSYIARIVEPGTLMSLPGYRGTGLLSETTAAADLAGFTLEPDDIADLRDCRPGNCAVQLPAARMPAARAAA